MEEIWKSIPRLGECYEFSNYGNYRSNKSGEWKNRMPYNNGNGYLYTTFYSSEIKGYVHYFLHRLIYEAFYGQIPEGMQIDHIDGNKTNNKLSNLRMLNNRDNALAAIDRKRAAGKIKSKRLGILRYVVNGYTYYSVSVYPYGRIYNCKDEEEANKIADDAERGILPKKYLDRLAKKGIVIGKQE